MKAYVFPGQGSQKKGMGAGLFNEFPELMRQADTILGYSVEELCLKDSEQKLNLTQFTQPALFLVNALTWMKKRQTEGVPDVVAGHSLGEYNALFAAEVFDFETGLLLVRERGQLMGRAKGGGMAAVVGLAETAVREVLERAGVTEIDVANFNSPTQIVLSGPKERIPSLKPLFEAAGARTFVTLKVSAAFHSRYMEPARKEFRRFLENFTFQPPKIPVISNKNARPYTVEKLKSTLAGQIDHSVKWTESVRYMMGLGVDQFEEVGPGKVLNKLCSVILKQAEPLMLDEAPEAEPVAVPVPEPEPVVVPPPQPEDLLKAEAAEAKGEELTATSLGSPLFRSRYGTVLAYAAGSMGYGISSKAMVIRMSRSGLLSFYGSHGLEVGEVAEAVRAIRAEVGGGPFGVNLTYQLDRPEQERELVDLLLREGVRHVEAAGFIQITPALVLYRLKGAVRRGNGVMVPNQVLAKVSRPETAAAFMSPAPERLVRMLLDSGDLTQEEADLAPMVPISDTLCALADGAWLTEQADAWSLLPSLSRQRDTLVAEHRYAQPILIGAGGGIGTPESAAAAFIQGADFVLTGSINICSAEAGLSTAAKSMLEDINVQDTETAPAEDLFEMGARVRVLKRGVFFPMRAQKLYDIYRNHQSLAELDTGTRQQLEKILGADPEATYADAKAWYGRRYPDLAEQADRDSKARMALIFKWYLQQGLQAALRGDEKRRVDYQIFCGPSLGAYNQTPEGRLPCTARHVDQIGLNLMAATAALLNSRIAAVLNR